MDDKSTPQPLVIIGTAGTGSDIQPFVLLAAGLTDRGHRVVMLLPKYQEIFAKRAGTPNVAFGTCEEFEAVL